MPFDYKGAKDAGYSDEEIMSHLSQNDKSFDVQGALKAGYSPNEINQHLIEPKESSRVIPNASFTDKLSDAGGFFKHVYKSTAPELLGGYKREKQEQEESKPERSLLEKSGRIAGQFGLGIAENAAFPFTAPLVGQGNKSQQKSNLRENAVQDIEELEAKKYAASNFEPLNAQRFGGKKGEQIPYDWTQEDQNKLDSLYELASDYENFDEFTHEPIDLSVGGLIEKGTGIDTKPEGLLEHAANWTGFIKNPKNIVNLAKNGLKAKDVVKAILPSGTEAMRGLGAGTAMSIAEDGGFGPIGTMAALVIGDLMGAGSASVGKFGKKFITQPKKTLAESVAKFTKQEDISLQKSIIEDFRDAGIQADAGTITNSNAVKWMQSRLSQSGLVGEELNKFKEELTTQFKEEYKKLADSLGESNFVTKHQAGEMLQETARANRESDLVKSRGLYQDANALLKEKAFVDSRKLANTLDRIEKDLSPGSVKSVEQQTVLDKISKLKKDIHDSEGNLIYANVKDLMNTKIALNDIIKYEVQGGAKQLLKSVVGELDRAIISHGKENSNFAKKYVEANKNFAQHAKTFRTPQVESLLKEGADPTRILNKMNTIKGIRDIQKVLSTSSEGKEVFNNLKRHKLDEVVGKNLVDSTTEQVKLGTFSKLLEKGNNREIIREILGPKEYNRLVKLQKNAGRIADAANQFYNASKSGVVAADAAVLAQGLSSVASVLMGNPWPLLKVTGGIIGGRKLANLLADKEFLKLLEEAIIKKGKPTYEENIINFQKLRPYFQRVLQQ